MFGTIKMQGKTFTLGGFKFEVLEPIGKDYHRVKMADEFITRIWNERLAELLKINLDNEAQLI